MLRRKEEIFSEASKALKQRQLADETEASDGVSGAKKIKTSVDENMPSFLDMMAYIQKKVRPQMNSVVLDSADHFCAARDCFISSADNGMKTSSLSFNWTAFLALIWFGLRRPKESLHG